MVQKLLWSMELCYLAICTQSDVRTGLISVRLSVALCLCGMGVKILTSGEGMSAVVFFWMLAGLLPGLAVMLAAWVSKGAFGMGDAWMILVSCTLSGCAEGCLLLWRAFVFGGLYGVWSILLRRKSKEDTVLFAPCMLAACMIRICGV